MQRLSRLRLIPGVVCLLFLASSALAVLPPKNTLPDFDAAGGMKLGTPRVASVAFGASRDIATNGSSRKTVRITDNLTSGTPRAIWSARPLSDPTEASPADAARQFVRANRGLWRLSDPESLVVQTEVRDRHTGVTHVYMKQTVGGVPVFAATVGVHLNARRQVLAVDGDVFPHAASAAWNAQLSADDAVRHAARHAGIESFTPARVSSNGFTAPQLRSRADVTRIIYAISDPPRPAYRTVIDKNGNEWYDIIVDAETGALLHRRNLYQFVGALSPSTPEANPAAPRGLAYHEHPLATVRGTNDLNRKYTYTCDPTGQPRGIANAPLFGADSSTVTANGGNPANATIAQTLLPFASAASPSRSNALPFSTSPQSTKGWLAPIGGTYYTYGNNVDAKDDHAGDNEVTIGARANGGATGDFSGPSFVYKNFYGQNGPYAAEPPESPASAARLAGAAPDLNAATTTLFYASNWYHDLLWHLGFDEAAGNFQNDNFGRGGKGGDFVFADSQDGSGTNNANFGTPADGSNPRMQMFLFGGPERDGTLDVDVIIHEYTHGVSNRLVGGPDNVDCLGVGLVGESGGMGEGWGDWFAAMLADEPTTGEYVTGDTSIGIRRFAMNAAPDDFTYAFLCTGPASNPSLIPCAVHDGGEFWSAMLWETREAMINRYHNRTSATQFPTFTATGSPAGNIRNAQGRTFDGSGNASQIDQVSIEHATFAAMFRVIDGMKFAPCNPTMVDMRDAILTADRAQGGEFQDLIWRSFANRGVGDGATSTGGPAMVIVESFAVPATVSACEAAGGPLPAPQFTVTSTAANSVTITIAGNGATEYIIERGSSGAGSPVDPQPFTEIGRTSSTTFVDTPVDGGITFWYRVRAARNDDCISGTNTVSITPMGGASECTNPPNFVGLDAATDAGNCANVFLTWSAATSSCPANSGITYSVYRSTDASFTPGSANLIASGLAGTNYVDTPGQFDTIFYYVVRAEDSTSGHGGPNNGGNVDQNLVRHSAMITSPVLLNEGFSDDVESGVGTSQSAHFSSNTPIMPIPQRGGWFRDSNPAPAAARSGSTVWHTYNPDNQSIAAGTSLVYELTSDVMTLTPDSILTFFHTFQTEGGFDGGVVEYALVDAAGNAGTWQDLGPLMYEGGYNGALTAATSGLLNSNPLRNRAAYTGGVIGAMKRVRAFVGSLVPSGATSQRIKVRFVFGNDVANHADTTVEGDFYPGWYIDDLSLDKSCCPSTAAPTKLRARNTKEGWITLSWTAPKNTTVQKYLVYREAAGDTVPQVFDEQIAEVSGSVREYTDKTVEFGVTYYYVVRALPVNGCPSEASNAASRGAAVACTTAPTFGGLTAVNAPVASTCTLGLSWSAGTASCPGALVTYNVYRSTDAAFSPSASTLIAHGLTGTSYTDAKGLVSGATYYYVVRAEDSTDNGTGPHNGGNEDANVKRVSGSPIGPLVLGANFSDDVEPAANPGYTTFSTHMVGGWAVTLDPTAKSPTHSWFASDDQPGVAPLAERDSRLTMPALNLTSTSTLTFWHNFDFARFAVTGSPATNYQSGGILELSADGDTWIDLGPWITTGGYNGVVDPESMSPLKGRNAWVGSSDGDLLAGRADAMKQVSVNLGAAIAAKFNGATSLPNARIRFRLGGTFQALIGGIQGTGWGVDNLTVTGVQTHGPCTTAF
jgi:hypothetical protein